MFDAAGSSWTTMAKFHLGYATTLWEGPEAAEAVMRDSIAQGDRLRHRLYAMFARVEELFRMDVSGEWDEMLALADEIIDWAESAGAAQHGTLARSRKARILALRGQLHDAGTVMRGLLDRARRIGDLQALTPALATQSLLLYMNGEPTAARALLHELTPDRLRSESPAALVFRLLVACGDPDRVAILVDDPRPGSPRFENNIQTGRALILENRKEFTKASECYADVVRRWRQFGDPYELAHALAGQARMFRQLGKEMEAEPLASESASLFDQLSVFSAARSMPLSPIERTVEI
jgi:hypothetical protein